MREVLLEAPLTAVRRHRHQLQQQQEEEAQLLGKRQGSLDRAVAICVRRPTWPVAVVDPTCAAAAELPPTVPSFSLQVGLLLQIGGRGFLRLVCRTS